MLREIKNVRQIPGEPSRRWFNCEEMDLIIWHELGTIIGFQLCYDKKEEEKALSWKAETGLVHEKVDNGELRDGHYKATPILIQNGKYNVENIRINFLKYSVNISDEVRSFVLHCLVG